MLVVITSQRRAEMFVNEGVVYCRHSHAEFKFRYVKKPFHMKSILKLNILFLYIGRIIVQNWK